MNDMHARVRGTHALAGAALALTLAAPGFASAAETATVTETATVMETATAAGPSVADTASVAAGAILLPPLRFNGSVAGDELYARLKQEPRYMKLDRELVGSPIELRVTQASEATAGGKAAGLASAIFAGSTLGLLPVVTNADLVITYAYTVNGTEVASWSYRKNFTRSQNIYAEDKSYGLGAEALAWVKTTADQFLADSRTDLKLAELVREYEFYFGAVRK